MTAKTSTRTGREVTKADEAALAADLRKAVADLKGKYEAALITTTGAETALEAAKLNLSSAYVIQSRVVYAAAMLVPYQGKPNHKGAAKILLSTNYGDKVADEAAVKAKNTLTPYLKAGIALREAGFNLRTTAPDDEERAIVEKALKAHYKEISDAKKAKEKELKGEAANADKGESNELPPADDEAATFSAVLAMFARANNVLDTFVKGGGIVTTDDVDTTAAIFAKFAEKLVGLAQ